jgi:hypothetical protein
MRAGAINTTGCLPSLKQKKRLGIFEKWGKSSRAQDKEAGKVNNNLTCTMPCPYSLHAAHVSCGDDHKARWRDWTGLM